MATEQQVRVPFLLFGNETKGEKEALRASFTAWLKAEHEARLEKNLHSFNWQHYIRLAISKEAKALWDVFEGCSHQSVSIDSFWNGFIALGSEVSSAVETVTGDLTKQNFSMKKFGTHLTDIRVCVERIVTKSQEKVDLSEVQALLQTYWAGREGASEDEQALVGKASSNG